MFVTQLLCYLTVCRVLISYGLWFSQGVIPITAWFSTPLKVTEFSIETWKNLNYQFLMLCLKSMSSNSKLLYWKCISFNTFVCTKTYLIIFMIHMDLINTLWQCSDQQQWYFLNYGLFDKYLIAQFNNELGVVLLISVSRQFSIEN